MTELALFADYFQIYLCDPAHNEDWSALVTDQTVDDRIIALPHTLVFSTERNMMVAVRVTSHERAPDLADRVTSADHAVSGSLWCSSGEIKLAGLTDHLPDAFSLKVTKGHIGVAFLSFDFDTIEPVERLDGNDRYELHVWPTDRAVPASVLKRWKVPAP